MAVLEKTVLDELLARSDLYTWSCQAILDKGVGEARDVLSLLARACLSEDLIDLSWNACGVDIAELNPS